MAQHNLVSHNRTPVTQQLLTVAAKLDAESMRISGQYTLHQAAHMQDIAREIRNIEVQLQVEGSTI